MVLILSVLVPITIALGSWWISLQQTTRVLAERSRPLADPQVNALTARLAQAAGMDRLEVLVFDVEQVNGLAAPDGRIYLTRGFIERHRVGAVTAEELASVIAHELGHVAMGHTQRRMIDVTGRNAVFVVLAALLNRFIPVVGVWVANMVTGALAAGLSRKAEHEADAYASALLVKAGIGTAPQKSLFGKLARLTGHAGEGMPEWLRSHPATAERIARIEAREARWRQP